MTGAERRHIGALTAASMLVGMVVGVSIFILPGQLAASAGPGMLVAYLLASVVALVACLVGAEVGVALPVSGASYVLLSRCLSPFAAFISMWFVVGASCMAMALLAYGFGDYLALLVPGASGRGVAIGVVLVLGALNVLGTRTALVSQNFLVIVMVLALVVFCVAGVPKVDPANFEPFLPRGIDAALAAAVPAFFSFTGFMLIVEIGGEVRDPARNVPIAMFGAFFVVLILYLAVAFVVVGVEHWSSFAGVAAPVGMLAQRLLPGWGGNLIAATALLATLTSLNGILIGYARDLLALARAGHLPARFARLSPRGEPVSAMLLLTALSLTAILAGATVLEYATAVVVAAMFVQMLYAVAVWRLPRVAAEEYRASAFRLPRRVRPVVIAALFASSAYLFWRGVRDATQLVGGLAIFASAGVAYYVGRRWWLSRTDTARAR